MKFIIDEDSVREARIFTALPYPRYHEMLKTFNPMKAELRTPSGTQQLGEQLSALLGIMKGTETFAPSSNWI
jgi:hypothetical protein